MYWQKIILVNKEIDDDAIEFLAVLTEEGPQVKLLEALQKKITSESEAEWIDDFIAAGGAEWLIEVLISSIHKPSEYDAISPPPPSPLLVITNT